MKRETLKAAVKKETKRVKAEFSPNMISEAELSDAAENHAVKTLSVVQSKAGKYRIVINLTWKEGDWNLSTTRGNAREWASLDTLVRHLRERYIGKIPVIKLIIKR